MNSTKQTKQTVAPAAKKNINFLWYQNWVPVIKKPLGGLYSLSIALAEIATAYIFATQDNKVLWVLAGVLGFDAAQRLAYKFLR